MFRLANSIARRLTVVNLAGSAAALLLASAVLFAYDLTNSRRAMIDDLNIQAEIVGYNSVTPLVFDDPEAAEKTLSALQASPHIVYAGIYDPSNQFFAGYWRDPGQTSSPPPLARPEQLPNRLFRDSNFGVVQSIVLDGKMLGTVYIRSDVRSLVQQFERYLAVLIAIFLSSLGAAFLVARISQHSISDPIVNLARTARIISQEKNYSVRAAPHGNPDEMGILVNAFNDMLSEIELRTAALEESERQFRSLADSVPQLAWMAEPNGYIFWYNQRWYDYTGETPESMAGWGWQSVHNPESLPAVLKNWHDVLARKERFEMVFPLRGKDGNYREFLTIALPVRDAHGTIVRWFGTNTDITDQRRSEEALRQTEKLAAVGRLAASIAHEINNPLEAVSNLIYLANRQPDRAQGYLTIAEQELDRIGEITKNTLGFYRDTTTPTWIKFPEIADSVLLLYDRKIRLKNIQIGREYDEDVQLFGFSGELRQILANLISNAVEASGSGGRLIVRASAVGTNGHARGIRVTIADAGRGIPQEQLKQIFEPFFTTKKDSGTGLGLWLTQTLVQKHQGNIRVKSRNQGAKTGTVFSVFLPNTSS